ncbi:hypothetical protein Sango_0915300 [Sesamum angolense]|uniref:Uncharacterized protein n=1 Tax=Sesamum angolense TaxID=2727404 RepID=A0AAE1WYF6_9LAMI|nr:hypothetical protein Sango_0915300 [Sesamum angolense]
MLSRAWKGILIKAVLQAIPTYAMGVFRLPVGVISDIQSLCADFWWHNRGQRKVRWIAWAKLCSRSLSGGLGFWELRAFNQAMLAKQCWHILTNPTSFLGCLLKAWYFPHSSFLDAQLTSQPSLTWRSLLSARPLLTAGIRWQVGSGSSIRVWGSPWIPRPTSFRSITPVAVHEPNLLVSELVDDESGEWKVSRLREIFLPIDIETILSIPLGRTIQPDLIVWHYMKDGRFSIRSAYHLARSLKEGTSSSKETQPWSFLWAATVPQKNRNGDMMEGKHQHAEALVAGVSRYFVEFQRASGSRRVGIGLDGVASWKPPEAGWVKVNYDGALFADGKERGVGVVARSEIGDCVA